MADEESKEFAIRFFEALQYKVAAVPTADDLEQQRADLVATHEDDLFVIEAKGKAEQQDFLAHQARVRESGSSILTREVKPWNAVSSMIKTAAGQLGATPAPLHAVRLLWVSCLHRDWEFVLEATRRRLFGQALLSRFAQVADDLPEMLDPQECFYYSPADFVRFHVIDGAILAGPKGFSLLVNEFGQRAVRLRATRLHREMLQHGAVVDPLVLERAGQAMAIRKSIPVRDHRARWQYLLDTYGVLTSAMHEHVLYALHEPV